MAADEAAPLDFCATLTKTGGEPLVSFRQPEAKVVVEVKRVAQLYSALNGSTGESIDRRVRPMVLTAITEALVAAVAFKDPPDAGAAAASNSSGEVCVKDVVGGATVQADEYVRVWTTMPYRGEAHLPETCSDLATM